MNKRFYISSEPFEYESKQDITSSFSQDYTGFENQYNTFYEEIYEEKDIMLPSSIFSREMGSLQAIVRYLKDYRKLKLSEIAELTGRDQRTVWNTYNQAKDAVLIVEDSEAYIPLSTIKDRKRSILGNIVLFLRKKGFSFNEIASLLKRNYQTIYTTYRKSGRGPNE